jgi:hypothetical protein
MLSAARPRRQPTDDWSQVQLFVASPEQATYEILRPIVLFGQPPPVPLRRRAAVVRVPWLLEPARRPLPRGRSLPLPNLSRPRLQFDAGTAWRSGPTAREQLAAAARRCQWQPLSRVGLSGKAEGHALAHLRAAARRNGDEGVRRPGLLRRRHRQIVRRHRSEPGTRPVQAIVNDQHWPPGGSGWGAGLRRPAWPMWTVSRVDLPGIWVSSVVPARPVAR